jgi:hypothetical protein
MVHIILTGATGLVGSAVLSQVLSSPSITHVSILSRRPVAAAEDHPKAKVIIHSDFSKYSPTVLDQISGADGCIWAQGRSSVGMSEAAYSELTHDWPLAAAKAFGATNNPAGWTFNFVYVSGEGADPMEASRALFGRVKGRAEKDLLDLASLTESLCVYKLRPAGIDGSDSTARPERPASWQERVAGLFFPAVKLFAPQWHTPVDSLAKVAVGLASGSGKPLLPRRRLDFAQHCNPNNGRTLKSVAFVGLLAQARRSLCLGYGTSATS